MKTTQHVNLLVNIRVKYKCTRRPSTKRLCLRTGDNFVIQQEKDNAWNQGDQQIQTL